jgi:hypothetical protein
MIDYVKFQTAVIDGDKLETVVGVGISMGLNRRPPTTTVSFSISDINCFV